LEGDGLQFGQGFHHLSIKFNGLFGCLILRFGQSLTDGFAILFASPEIIRAFLHPTPADFAAERAADDGALAEPSRSGQVRQKFLIRRRRMSQGVFGLCAHGCEHRKRKRECQHGICIYTDTMFTTAPLFGKFHSPLKDAVRPLRRRPLHHLECLCAHRIDPALLQPHSSGANSRQRLYTPKLTFLAFLDQILNPDSSCRSAVGQILSSYQSLPHYPQMAANTSAYCQARARWTCGELLAIRRQLASRLAGSADSLLPGIPGQRPLKVIDGTCLNLPDSPANRAACPQAPGQQPGCGFPLLRLVGVFCLKNGSLLEETSAPYTTSENALFQELWPTLQAGDILLADRNFSSYASLAALQQQHVDCLFHLHASRSSDFRQGRRLGPDDRLVTWLKPKAKPANLSPAQWAQLPATLTVRQVRFRLDPTRGRCKTITLVTTLTDPKLWPVQLLAALYHRRWKIELYWDDLKTTLKMDRLSCQTPAMIHKEIQMHLIAYNLIRALMAEAALAGDVPVERISFTGTRDAAHHYSQAWAKIPSSHRQRRLNLYAEMLAAIANDPVPERPDRREPRCQKQRPKNYPFLTKPRHLMKDPPKRCRDQKNFPSLS
jgi:Transposase DDE domain